MAGTNSGQQDTKTDLLDAAIRLFAANGYDGTTVRDIADQAGVNISLVSYHFGGKEGIYRACISGLHQSKLEAIQRILRPPETFDEFKARLRMHHEEVLNWYIENPELMKMIHREIDRGVPIVDDLFKEVFLKALETSQSFFREAKKRGFISKDADPKILAQLMGACVHQIGNGDNLRQKYFGAGLADARYRTRMIDQILMVFTGELGKAPDPT